MGVENLIPFSQRSKEEASEMGRRGGVSSGETRRAQKTMREMLKTIVDSDLTGEEAGRKLEHNLQKAGLHKRLPNNYRSGLAVAMLQKALNGSVKAAEFIRDTLGEKPIEQFEDLTPESPIVLGVIPSDKVEKAKAEHEARQLEGMKKQ